MFSGVDMDFSGVEYFVMFCKPYTAYTFYHVLCVEWIWILVGLNILLVCCEKELEDMDFVDFSVKVVNV